MIPLSLGPMLSAVTEAAINCRMTVKASGLTFSFSVLADI